jgi:hypothetical protein
VRCHRTIDCTRQGCPASNLPGAVKAACLRADGTRRCGRRASDRC